MSSPIVSPFPGSVFAWTLEFHPGVSRDLEPKEFVSELFAKGRIVQATEAWAKSLGYGGSSDLTNVPVMQVFDSTGIQTKDFWRSFYAGGCRLIRGECVVLDRQGARVLVNHCVERVAFDGHGHLMAVSGIQEVRPPVANENVLQGLLTQKGVDVSDLVHMLKEAFRSNHPTPPATPQEMNIGLLLSRLERLEQESSKLRKYVIEGNGQKSLLSRVETLEVVSSHKKDELQFWVPIVLSLAALGFTAWEIFRG